MRSWHRRALRVSGFAANQATAGKPFGIPGISFFTNNLETAGIFLGSDETFRLVWDPMDASFGPGVTPTVMPITAERSVKESGRVNR
jgi:hypothetical protein